MLAWLRWIGNERDGHTSPMTEATRACWSAMGRKTCVTDADELCAEAATAMPLARTRCVRRGITESQAVV